MLGAGYLMGLGQFEKTAAYLPMLGTALKSGGSAVWGAAKQQGKLLKKQLHGGMGQIMRGAKYNNQQMFNSGLKNLGVGLGKVGLGGAGLYYGGKAMFGGNAG